MTHPRVAEIEDEIRQLEEELEDMRLEREWLTDAIFNTEGYLEDLEAELEYWELQGEE